MSSLAPSLIVADGVPVKVTEPGKMPVTRLPAKLPVVRSSLPPSSSTMLSAVIVTVPSRNPTRPSVCGCRPVGDVPSVTVLLAPVPASMLVSPPNVLSTWNSPSLPVREMFTVSTELMIDSSPSRLMKRWA